MTAATHAVLVTGGAGFIGSALVAELAEAGHRVVVLDSLLTGRRENLDDVGDDRVRLVVGDVRDADTVAPLLREASVVYHLACVNLRRALVAPREAHDVNATATLDLLMAARAAGIRRFVHVSSSEVYGNAIGTSIGEQHPTLPTTSYGASKLAGEAYARAFRDTYGLPTTIVRPFNSYGPRCHHAGASGEVIPRFLLRAMAGRPLVIFGDGRQSRDFTYVTDTARGIALAGTTDAVVGRTINIGSGREVSVLDLAAKITAVTGRPDVVVTHMGERPGDVMRQRAHTGLSEEVLGFAPCVTLDEGLGKLRQWYLSRDVDLERLLAGDDVPSWGGGE